MKEVPKYNELMWPTLKAINALGGSGTNSEIVEKVIELKKIPEAVQEIMYKPDLPSLDYRLACARCYLKAVGALENSGRGVWSLTQAGQSITEADLPTLLSRYRSATAKKRKPAKGDDQQESMPREEEDEVGAEWKHQLLSVLGAMHPSAFERLSQRLLREAGFIEVQVTGRCNDGGIDGYGTLKVNLLSFRVIFQCKRYKGLVTPEIVRDFRGAMQGRAEKGLLITTGVFTSNARREANRDGAPPIDLIDGDELCDLLKQYRIGVDVELIEKVIIHKSTFEAP